MDRSGEPMSKYNLDAIDKVKEGYPHPTCGTIDEKRKRTATKKMRKTTIFMHNYLQMSKIFRNFVPRLQKDTPRPP